MALGAKYQATFNSLAGEEYEVTISIEGYVGSIVPIKMGVPPFTLTLAGEDDDRFTPLKPITCTLNLLSTTRLQFSDLFTGVEESIKVSINKNSTLWWEGWVLPDQYEEPFTEGSNYIVSISAVCGLERLEAYDWDQTGRVSIVSALSTILAKTGIPLSIMTACNVYEAAMSSGVTHDPLALTFIYKDRFYEEDGTPFTYKRVLEEILKYAGCQIRQVNGTWTVKRISELTGSHFIRLYNSAGVYVLSNTVNPLSTTAFETSTERLSFMPAAKSQKVTLKHGTLGNLLPGGDFSYDVWLTETSLRDFTNVDIPVSRVVTNSANLQYGAFLSGYSDDLTEQLAYVVNDDPKAIAAGGGNKLMLTMSFSTKPFLSDVVYTEFPNVYIRMRIKVGSKYLVGGGVDDLTWSSSNGLVVIEVRPGATTSIQFITPEITESGTVEVRLLKLGNPAELAEFDGYTINKIQLDALLGGEWQFESNTLETAIVATSSLRPDPIEVLIGEAPTATHLSATTLSDGTLTENWYPYGVVVSRKRHRQLLQDIINQLQAVRYRIKGTLTGFNDWFSTTSIDSRTYHINGGSFNPNTDQWSVTLYEISSTEYSATVTSTNEVAPATETSTVAGATPASSYATDWGSIAGKPSNDAAWSSELGLALGLFTFESDELARVRGFVAVDALAMWMDLQSLMDRKAEAGLSIIAGTGLTGGGMLTADRTLSLTTLGTNGSYGSNINSAVITVDAQGRITAATQTAIRQATEAQSGVVSTTTQRFAGVKTFDDGVRLAAAASLESSTFSTGFSGNGARLSVVNSLWRLELDDMMIRGALFASELIVNQISALNGSEILSPGRGKIETITPGAEPFDVTVSDPQGGNFASFSVGDIVMIQQVRPNDSAIVKRIVYEVENVSGRTVSLWSTSGGPTQVGAIEVGDTMVAIGNVSNSARRASIYRSVTDTNNPFVRVFTGVDSWSDWLHQDRISLAYGNLNGSYGYATDIFGFGAGDYAGANLTLDPTNGLRLRDGALVLAQLNGDAFTIGNVSDYIAFNATLGALTLNIDGALNLNEADGLTLEVDTTETTDGAKAVKWMSGTDVYSSILGVDVTDGLEGGLWYSDFGLALYAAGLGLGLGAGFRFLLPSDGSGGQFAAISAHTDNANSYRTVIEMRSRDSGVPIRIYIPELPISSTGLPTGTLWNDSGTVKIKT